jgi:hypothetical protein
MLVMISSPTDGAVLDVEAERARLNEGLSDLKQRELVTVERMEAASLGVLQSMLRRGRYHIIHYIGHGGYDERTDDGVLILEDAEGRARPVSGQDLGTLLYDHRSLRLRCSTRVRGRGALRRILSPVRRRAWCSRGFRRSSPCSLRSQMMRRSA